MQKLINGAKELGIDLTPAQVEQFELYYRELVDWNKRVNLTAITDYDEVQLKHFLDSLTLVLAGGDPFCKSKLRFLDIGTGGGFPGIPLKIVFPTIELTLIESTGKKTTFLHHLLDVLNLNDVTVLNERAESLAHRDDYREQFDIVACRGVAALATACELALPFCKQGGIFIAQKKGTNDEEVHKASNAIEKLGGELKRTARIGLSVFDEERLLVIMHKIHPTPDTYPRRPGIPAKRPL
jgi:16S rRNA (guanine527-N7)-methyltransferase